MERSIQSRARSRFAPAVRAVCDPLRNSNDKADQVPRHDELLADCLTVDVRPDTGLSKRPGDNGIFAGITRDGNPAADFPVHLDHQLDGLVDGHRLIENRPSSIEDTSRWL